MKKRGSVTVFFSLFMVVFLILMQAVFRSVQTAGGRVQTEAGVEEGLYSVFAGFDRALFERYHVFFLDGGYGTGTLQPGRMYRVVEESLEKSMDPGRKFAGIRGENLWKCSDGGGAITGYTLATDMQGQLFRKQAVDYMKETVGIQGIQLLLQKSQMQEEILKAQEAAEERSGAETAQKEYDRALQNANESEMKSGGEEEGVKGEAEIPPDFVNPLDIIKDLRKRGILSLVLPVEAEVSQQGFGAREALGSRSRESGMGLLYRGKAVNGTVDQLLFQEYMMKHLECYGETEEEAQRMRYQLEYVIGGKNTDEENLKAVVKQLLMIREAANMAYLLSSASYQTQIHQLAAVISAAIGFPILEPVVSLALQAAWAFGESLLDVRQLLQGGRIPLLKTGQSWLLSLERVKDLPEILRQNGKKNENGMSYKEYLRLLIYLGKDEVQVYRTMDMAEQSISALPGKENFRMDLCVGYLEMEWKVICCEQSFLIQRKYGYDM